MTANECIETENVFDSNTNASNREGTKNMDEKNWTGWTKEWTSGKNKPQKNIETSAKRKGLAAVQEIISECF